VGGYMVKKEIVAMILAGGKGTRLGALTRKLAKPYNHPILSSIISLTYSHH